MTKNPLAAAAFEAKSPRRRRVETGEIPYGGRADDEAPVFLALPRQPAAPALGIPDALASRSFDAVSPRRRRVA